MPKNAQDLLTEFFKKQEEEIKRQKSSVRKASPNSPEQEWDLLMIQLGVACAADHAYVNIDEVVRKARALFLEYPGRFKCPHLSLTFPERYGMMTDKFMVCEVCLSLIQ